MISFSGFYCNFDNGRLCQGVSQGRDDKFDWTLRKTSTPSGGTGPQTDHSGKGMLNTLTTYFVVNALMNNFSVFFNKNLY